ncbi:MAG: FtsX-like permease family protein [Chitinophagaceae bacterium]
MHWTINPAVSMAVVPAMRTDFPELEQVSQVRYRKSGLVKVGQERYNEKGFAFADEKFAEIFDYEWLAGDPKMALTEPNSVVLTESIPRKYFGHKDATEQIINLDNRLDLKVTGLIKDVPGNTHLPFIFLVSFETIKKDMKQAMSNFHAILDGSFAYIVIALVIYIKHLQKKIPDFISKNWGREIAKEATLNLQPFKEIHFDQRYLNNTISSATSRETYWTLAAVALFIIITACINFIDLATYQAMSRAKEVGVRKVMGAHRYQLIQQFLGETTFMVIVALLLGLIAVVAFLPQAGRWFDIKIQASHLMEWPVFGMLTAITLLVILLAGLYPAFVQSSFRPVDSLKPTKSFSFRGLTLCKSLVFIQFAVSQILIVGTLVVAGQMDFFQNQDLGYNKEVEITFRKPDKGKREALRQQLAVYPGVKELSFSSGHRRTAIAPPAFHLMSWAL